VKADGATGREHECRDWEKAPHAVPIGEKREFLYGIPAPRRGVRHDQKGTLDGLKKGTVLATWVLVRWTKRDGAHRQLKENQGLERLPLVLGLNERVRQQLSKLFKSLDLSPAPLSLPGPVSAFTSSEKNGADREAGARWKRCAAVRFVARIPSMKTADKGGRATNRNGILGFMYSRMIFLDDKKQRRRLIS
jgi:hypothetical protein